MAFVVELHSMLTEFREVRKFKNSARRDGLELEHWVKVTDEVNTGAKTDFVFPYFLVLNNL